MFEIRIDLEKGHGLDEHADALHAMVAEVIPTGFGGVSTDETGVRLHLADIVNWSEVPFMDALFESIRTFQPPERLARPTASKYALFSKLQSLEAEIEVLREAIYTIKSE